MTDYTLQIAEVCPEADVADMNALAASQGKQQLGTPSGTFSIACCATDAVDKTVASHRAYVTVIRPSEVQALSDPATVAATIAATDWSAWGLTEARVQELVAWRANTDPVTVHTAPRQLPNEPSGSRSAHLKSLLSLHGLQICETVEEEV